MRKGETCFFTQDDAFQWNEKSFGVSFERRRNMLFLHQPVSSERVLERFRINFAKPAPAPIFEIISNIVLESSGDEAKKFCSERFPYRMLMGSLLFLSTQTHPDNSSSVNCQSRFMEIPL